MNEENEQDHVNNVLHCQMRGTGRRTEPEQNISRLHMYQ